MEEESNYPKLEDEIKKKKKILPLRFVDEDNAQQIEEDLEKEAELESELLKKTDLYRFAGFDPNVIDFMRRCDTNIQALEIISYLENIGDISTDQGKSLRDQLENDGLRSFGSKKEKGFYFNPDA